MTEVHSKIQFPIRTAILDERRKRSWEATINFWKMYWLMYSTLRPMTVRMLVKYPERKSKIFNGGGGVRGKACGRRA